MKHCKNLQCPERIRMGRPAEFDDEIETCSVCEEELADGPGPAELIQTSGSPTHLWGRLAFTLVVMAACIASAKLGVWGLALDANTLSNHGSPWMGSLSIFSIGLMPVISAFVVVEFLSLVVPPWRRWRIQGAAGRRRLSSVVWILSVLFFVWQAYGIVLFLQNHKLLKLSSVIGVGWQSYAMVGGSFALGTILLLACTVLVQKYGLGNGFSIVLSASLLPSLWEPVQTARQLLAPRQCLMVSLLLIGYIGLVVFLLRAKLFSLRPRSSEEASYSMFQSLFVAPTSALTPYIQAAGIFSLVYMTLEWLKLPTGWMMYRNIFVSTFVIPAIILTVGVVLLSLLFYPLRHVATWQPVLEDESDHSERAMRKKSRGQRRRAILFTWFVLILLLGLDVWISFKFLPLPFASILILVAVFLDLVREWRATSQLGKLVTVREIHRLYTLDSVVAALHLADIPVFFKSLRHRSLLYVFGPYIPIEVQVPVAHQAEARDILDALFAEADQSMLGVRPETAEAEA
ncbi:MAG: hypothetical protein EP343_04260 [Deltaproteobacteria bacterium]|nr:MAG: hypothetical protein EP343_04260 [Deltaproteobacteria bacterium]